MVLNGCRGLPLAVNSYARPRFELHLAARGEALKLSGPWRPSRRLQGGQRLVRGAERKYAPDR